MGTYGSGIYGVGIYGTGAYPAEGIVVQIDWDKDGDYTDLNDNVTRKIRQGVGLSFEYGRDQSTALAPTVAGRGQFTLNNDDKRFNPRNTTSPIYPNLKPARPVRVLRTVNTNTYTLFLGHTDDSPINPDADSKTVQISLVDSLADFRGATVSTRAYSGLRTGEAIDIILNEIGWTGTRDLDAGATVLPWWWEDGTDAFAALETLIRCEGPPALLTIGSDGGIIFKDRHHRLLDAASTTSQSTWRSAPGSAEPIIGKPFIYDDAWRNIINTGRIPIEVRTVRGLEAVWTLESPIGFTAGQTQTFIASASDPFTDARRPVSDTDYIVNSGSIDSTSISRSAGASTVITVTAGAGGAQISGLQLRARPIQVAYTVSVTASDAASITAYGPRSFPGELEFCNPYDAQAVLDTAVELRAQPLPIVTVRFMIGKLTVRGALVLARDMSNRVTIVDPQTSLNDDFYIESFLHDMTSEYDHAVTIGCEAVPTAGTVTPSNVFIIGSSAVGHRIGDGLLAS